MANNPTQKKRSMDPNLNLRRGEEVEVEREPPQKLGRERERVEEREKQSFICYRGGERIRECDDDGLCGKTSKRGLVLFL